MEHHRTLVLNGSYKVVHIISWQRAITLLYSGSAETIMSWDKTKNDFVYCEYDKTVSNQDRKFVYRIPSVIRLLKSNVMPKKYQPKFSKINVFYRDDFECQYCGFTYDSNREKGRKAGSVFLTIDHIIPVSKGGKTTFENCVCACSDCNLKKGDKTAEETNLKLKKKPNKPTYEILVRRKMTKRQLPEVWKNYIKF
jgi:5-methylcytosine-specific restriction endonuclease McrA